MDRCALFVDAGYVLSDGAMAVHGTRHRDSVSWDYAGLLKLLAGLSRDRTGLPVLRCYWYEATVDSRRTSEHEVLADLPGLKLRLGKMRPGRREGIETEIHRDLTALARNGAVSDAVILSAEEDLAPVLAEVQDFGIRVVIVHISVDGDWTISRPLRQECDDIIEITGAHLRPFVDLITGAEPARSDEQYASSAYQSTDLAEGRSRPVGAVSHRGLPAAALPAAALPAAPAIYAAPLAGEYQRAGQPPGLAVAGVSGTRAGQGTPQGGSDSVQPGIAQGPDAARNGQGMPGTAGPSSQVSGGSEARGEEMPRTNDQPSYPPPEHLRGPMPAQPQNGLAQSALAPNAVTHSGQLQNGLPQNGLPQAGLPQNGLSQAGPPQAGFPHNSLPQAGPPQSGPPQAGLPHNSLPQNGLPQRGVPQGGVPQGGCRRVASPRAASRRAGRHRPPPRRAPPRRAPPCRAARRKAPPCRADHRRAA